MANNVNADIKTKFGLLICHLVASGFSFELIQDKVVRDPYFLFLERNDVDGFLSTPIETIVLEVFHKQIYIDYTAPIASEIFWAGQMYVSLLLNHGVPLQRSFLVYPLEKMIGLFDPYHEMGDDRLCLRYLEDEAKTSVLRVLMEGRLSARQLAFLAGVSYSAVIKYQSNESLFGMSASTASSFSSLLGVPTCVFVKESSFVPDISFLMEDGAFRLAFVMALSDYLGAEAQDISFVESTDDRRANAALLASYRALFDYRRFLIVKNHNGQAKTTALSPNVIRAIGKAAIARFIETLPEGTILF